MGSLLCGLKLSQMAKDPITGPLQCCPPWKISASILLRIKCGPPLDVVLQMVQIEPDERYPNLEVGSDPSFFGFWGFETFAKIIFLKANLFPAYYVASG